jgi:hypothetical protein
LLHNYKQKKSAAQNFIYEAITLLFGFETKLPLVWASDSIAQQVPVSGPACFWFNIHYSVS